LVLPYMASLVAKKKGNQLYYYVVESARVDGKPRIVQQTYLGSAERVAALVKDRTAPLPLSATTIDFGLPGALWVAAQQSGAWEALHSFWPQPRSGPSTAHYLLLAAIHRICRPGPKTEVPDWYRRSVLHSLWGFPSERFTSQEFWDCFDGIQTGSVEEDELDQAQSRLLAVWKDKQLVSRRLLAYDTTNFYTYVASTNTRSELAQRGHNKQGRHNLRQVGLSYVLDGEHGLSLCHHVYPGNVADAEEFPIALARIVALLDRHGMARDTVTLVLDKGSAALANTLELEQAGVGWISALPWNQAPEELRERPAEELSALSSAQPGVRAAAERLVVHGQEYLCVVKYSASFASEQLHSLTTTLSKAFQSMRRLSVELAKSGGRFTEAGIRNKIARWLSGTFVAELVRYQLDKREGFWHLQFDFADHAAHQPAGLDRRTSRSRVLRTAADRACVPRAQRRRLAGLGTHVPLDRQQDSGACVLLHAGDLVAAVHPQKGPDCLGWPVHGTPGGRTPPDPAVHLALSAPGRKGAKPRRYGPVQANPAPAKPGRRTWLGYIVVVPKLGNTLSSFRMPQNQLLTRSVTGFRVKSR
jgi:hypothetical protein